MDSLHTKINKSLKKATNFKQVTKTTISILKEFKSKKSDKIGFVSGAVTSGGPEMIDENIKRLNNITEKIRKTHKFPIFTSTDMFNQKAIKNFEDSLLPLKEFESNFLNLWKNLLESGYITDIFVAPGWEKSRGARFEHKIAKQAGLKIHYEKENK